MTAYRLAYVVALTSDPSQISHPAGTEPTVTPPHINTAPDGKPEGGGYIALFMEDKLMFDADMVRVLTFTVLMLLVKMRPAGV
jgi:hypothetical protein